MKYNPQNLRQNLSTFIKTSDEKRRLKTLKKKYYRLTGKKHPLYKESDDKADLTVKSTMTHNRFKILFTELKTQINILFLRKWQQN